MEKKIKYIILTLMVTIFSCKEPLPTQLVVDNSEEEPKLNIQVLSPEPDLFVYDSHYDTLGYIESTLPQKSIININGIKSTYRNITVKRTTAFALYINSNKPIYFNERLLGYESDYIGKTFFNNIDLKVLPRIIKYRTNKGIKDTSLGVVNVLSYRRGNNALFPFPYNSTVNFELRPRLGNNTKAKVKTPTEVLGKLIVKGSLKRGDLNITLKWNKERNSKIIIIVGGTNAGNKNVFPLYKLNLIDNGVLKIPKRLINSFPFNRFNQILFSFVRQKKTNSNSSEHLIVSQSIHNIKIDVP